MFRNLPHQRQFPFDSGDDPCVGVVGLGIDENFRPPARAAKHNRPCVKTVFDRASLDKRKAVVTVSNRHPRKLFQFLFCH